ncbi:MAG: hypothetical protein ACJAWF_000955 [Candidatus Azotimanducaceae bacterium]|jgi:hypothetical protein
MKISKIGAVAALSAVLVASGYFYYESMPSRIQVSGDSATIPNLKQPDIEYKAKQLQVLEPRILVDPESLETGVANNSSTIKCSKDVFYEADGTAFEAYMCEDSTTPHPYAEYPTESLESLAYSDSEAALMLGKRFSQTDEDVAVKWMVRASALDGGSTEPLNWLSNRLFSLDEIDGDFQAAIVGKRYVLQRVAQRLGDSPGAFVHTHNLLTAHGITEKQLETLDKVADKILESIAKISYDINGEETIIGGEVDA